MVNSKTFSSKYSTPWREEEEYGLIPIPKYNQFESEIEEDVIIRPPRRRVQQGQYAHVQCIQCEQLRNRVKEHEEEVDKLKIQLDILQKKGD